MTRSWGPVHQTPEEMAAYHRGQAEALDAVLVLLRRLFANRPPNVSDHPCYLAARRGMTRGYFYAIGQVLHLREGHNINQRIKAALKSKGVP